MTGKPDRSTHHNQEEAAIRYLRSARAVRERCNTILDLGLRDALEHFIIHPERLTDVAAIVHDEMMANYPDGDVPFHSRWRHFDAGGVKRCQRIDEALATRSRDERMRSKLELAIVSVLLDAGAGSAWIYRDPQSGAGITRSEGLAVASLEGFSSGIFGGPYEVTAEGLCGLTTTVLGEVFQVSDANPLVGLDGRVSLLNRLGEVMLERQEVFRKESDGKASRLGSLAGKISPSKNPVPAASVLEVVLDLFSPIWPGRISLGGLNLGDVWRHSKLKALGQKDTENLEAASGLVPLHKLSQWLTYSLLEPLAEGGVAVTDLDQLTGLAEYRNGGLFIDTGVLELRDSAQASRPHEPGAELIVEWRALTVALLDRLAQKLRSTLDMDSKSLPLVKILQGGSWSAGRKLAFERRPDGSPPLAIISDGTVF